MSWATICALNELTEGQGKAVEIDGYRLAVFLHAGRPYVLSDRCPHAGAPMSEGWVQDGCAVCPRHAWRFDLTDGTLHGSGAAGLVAYVSRTIDRNGRAWVQSDLPMP